MLRLLAFACSFSLLAAGCSTPGPDFPGKPVAGKPEPAKPTPPGPETPSAPSDVPREPMVATELVVGGVYASQPIREGLSRPYAITKILAIDGDTIMVRPYEGTMIERPKTIDTTKLKFFVSAQPVVRQGFLAEKPVLITVEKLTDEEREAVK